MSARNDLALIIAKAIDGGETPLGMDMRVADAILAAGWTPPPATPARVACPACQAPIGEPCTVASDTARRTVKWWHHAREDAASGS